MKIAIINSQFSTENNPYGDSFIQSRLKQLLLKKVDYKSYIIRSHYSKLILYLYTIIKKSSLDNSNVLLHDSSDRTCVISDNIGLMNIIISRLFPVLLLNKMKLLLLNHIDLQNDLIIHAHFVYPHGYCGVQLSKKYHLPCVITAHGSDIHTIPKKNKSIKKYTLKALQNADKVIFVSHALLKSAMELGYSGENAVVIPNGIDTSEFYPIEKPMSIQKTRFKQTKKYVVGFVGNLIPVKRADKFAEIFSKIHEEISDVEFIIVGDGYLSEDIKSECDKLGLIVTFAGRVPHEDVAYWINLFDVMIFPSREEGFGCVVLEANACGVPVVGSEAGGIPEAIGDVGIIIPEGENFENRFSSGVCDVLLGNCSIQHDALIKRANEYSWDTFVSKEIEVYNSLIKDK